MAHQLIKSTSCTVGLLYEVSIIMIKPKLEAAISETLPVMRTPSDNFQIDQYFIAWGSMCPVSSADYLSWF